MAYYYNSRLFLHIIMYKSREQLKKWLISFFFSKMYKKKPKRKMVDMQLYIFF